MRLTTEDIDRIEKAVRYAVLADTALTIKAKMANDWMEDFKELIAINKRLEEKLDDEYHERDFRRSDE